MPEILEVADAAELAARAARLMRAIIEEAIAARGVANVALSGGSTPGESYRLLAKSGLDFTRTRWFFVDERCVPPEHERSNYRAAKRDLFDPAGVPPSQVFRMIDAKGYDALLARELGGPFDLVIAGLGNDGHTASLFPGTGAVRDPASVVTVEPGGGLEPRISLGRSTLLAARRILILVSGAGKREALAQALAPGDEDEVPGRLYLAAPAGVATVIADRDALDSSGNGR